VLGIYDVEEKVGFMRMVDPRDGNTVLPIIRQRVRPGTIIYTDEWRGYAGLAAAGYIHRIVNHQFNFIIQ
jgi:transposase-like protein